MANLPILVVLAQSAAAPTPEDLSAQDIVAFTICKTLNLGGACITWNIPSQNTCSVSSPIPMPMSCARLLTGVLNSSCKHAIAVELSGSEWNDAVSSVQIPYGYRCRLWSSNNCDGDSTPDIYTPSANALPNGMDDKTTSFIFKAPRRTQVGDTQCTRSETGTELSIPVNWTSRFEEKRVNDCIAFLDAAPDVSNVS